MLVPGKFFGLDCVLCAVQQKYALVIKLFTHRLSMMIIFYDYFSFLHYNYFILINVVYLALLHLMVCVYITQLICWTHQDKGEIIFNFIQTHLRLQNDLGNACVYYNIFGGIIFVRFDTDVM